MKTTKTTTLTNARHELSDLYLNRIHWLAGRARIAGTWLPVSTLVDLIEVEGISPGELLADFADLKAVDLLAALAWAHDHREQVALELDTLVA